MAPGDLLVGPRGRRLCLALASGETTQSGGFAGDEFRSAVFSAAYALDRGAVFMVGGDAGLPTPTPADVARLLDAAPLSEPDELTLLIALRPAVDFARYWQEPDGEDVLGESPDVRAALVRVAEHIASSVHTSWWTGPLDRSAQWAVAPWYSDQPAAEVLAHWRSAAADEDATAHRDWPADLGAPFSATWWSKPPTELTRTTRSLGERGPAGLWLVEDSLGDAQASVRAVTTRQDARVYEIDGPTAWTELCRRYPLEVTSSRRHDWHRATGLDSRWVVPDWSVVARDIDAVHLTVAGYLTTAGRALVVAEDLRTVLAGWDPDQTFWLADVTTLDPVEQSWERDPAGSWHPVGEPAARERAPRPRP